VLLSDGRHLAYVGPTEIILAVKPAEGALKPCHAARTVLRDVAADGLAEEPEE